MELRRYAHLLRRHAVLLAVAVVVGAATGYLVSDRTQAYRAQATIYIGSRPFAAIADSSNASVAMDRLTTTFAAMITSTPVATAAIRLVNAPRTPNQVVRATTATAVPNSNYISVSVTDPDPVVAENLATGVARSFVDQANALELGTNSSSGAVASVFQPAGQPTTPLPTSTRRNLVLGLLFGLVGGAVVVAVLDHIDISIKTAESIERFVDLPVLGTIPILSYSRAAAVLTIAPPSQVISRPPE